MFNYYSPKVWIFLCLCLTPLTQGCSSAPKETSGLPPGVAPMIGAPYGADNPFEPRLGEPLTVNYF